jgi:hypothetical protein
MNWPALSRYAWRLSIGLAVALVASWIARQAHFEHLTAPDVEGLVSLISLIGGIYAVVFAFVIFVIWGQFTGVEDATVRECSLLKDLLRFRPISRSGYESHHPARCVGLRAPCCQL